MVVEINSENISLLDNSLLDEREVVSSLNSNPFGKYIVYLLDNTVVGYLYYSDIYDRIEINQFKIFDSFRRKGFGFSLLEHLIKKGKNITLEVKCDNISAISLYEKCGFKKVSVRKGYYDGVDGILMILEMK